ncbi:SGNH/GDSL hydrolase family protein [Limosilactobacillus reuteri]|uniref:SGNH/GDSL hydrolase family protein n=1 Tax=Limosilactobacillus reuteri TaxID=1598 RepID=UPI003FD20639
MRVTIDLMKKSTQIIDLSNVINPRVGDDDLLLPLHIIYGDNQTDMRGKDVEFLSNDPNKKNIYIAGTCNTNTPGDNLYMGNLTFRFPAGTFKADGTYDPDKTMFRIVDKETQKVISSVNVKITVMKNAIEFDFDPDKTSYDSRLENMLHDFHDKGQSMLDEIKDLNNQAKSNVSGDTATTAKEAKKQADQNAGDISDLKGEVAGARGRFANMADREDTQDISINQKESIANANANYAELKRKDAQQDAVIATKARQDFIVDYLTRMNLKPEGLPNAESLKSKYPNGTPGIVVTVDNGHGWIWLNKWVDFGVYQGLALANDDRQKLDNAVTGTTVFADPRSEPYNDLNTLPINQITTYATDITKISNAPKNLVKNNGATVATYSYATTSRSGAIQILVTNVGQMAWRACWGDPGTWTTWQTQLTSVQQTFDGANCEAPYNDLNTIPTNSRIIYGAGINHLANVPSELVTDKYEATGMQVITDGFNGDQPGSLQTIHLANSGKTYQRMIWGDSGHWQEWHAYADGEAYLPGKMIGAKTGVPYDDLNTFPMNQTITIAETPETITQIKNLPPLSGAGGLTVRSFSWGTSNIGGIQIAVDEKNVMYHRIAWGAENRWGAWRADRSDDTNSNDILPSLSLFQKVGVVGDSYASGELAFDSKNVDHYEISWLQIMARKNGVTGTNFSLGGMSTRTFLTNDHCLPLVQKSDIQDLYILALGINDEALGTDYIGTETDIDSGADTFYGNYGKIIKAIQAKAPKSKMVIATIADSSDVAQQFNSAIKTIANYFEIPVITLLSDPVFTSSFYHDHMVGGHPTGPIYASMANAYERLISRAMIDNLDYFMTYKQ